MDRPERVPLGRDPVGEFGNGAALPLAEILFDEGGLDQRDGVWITFADQRVEGRRVRDSGVMTTCAGAGRRAARAAYRPPSASIVSSQIGTSSLP